MKAKIVALGIAAFTTATLATARTDSIVYANSAASLTEIWVRRDPAINDNLIKAGTTLMPSGSNIVTVSIIDNRPGQLQTRTAYAADGSTVITASEPDYISEVVIY
jgi:hypothetical protein